VPTGRAGYGPARRYHRPARQALGAGRRRGRCEQTGPVSGADHPRHPRAGGEGHREHPGLEAGRDGRAAGDSGAPRRRYGEPGALLLRQVQRPRQAAHRLASRPAAAPLQGLDGAHAQPGPLGQRLLRQPNGEPVFPELCAENVPPSSRRVVHRRCSGRKYGMRMAPGAPVAGRAREPTRRVAGRAESRG